MPCFFLGGGRICESCSRGNSSIKLSAITNIIQFLFMGSGDLNILLGVNVVWEVLKMLLALHLEKDDSLQKFWNLNKCVIESG